MAKPAKRKRNDPITINTIYETIKERNFAQELWMDIISDIGDKPTYKRIKEMVKCVVNDKLGQFEREPVDNAERSQRSEAFTEISIMAYTVDRVISEFLYRRLQNEFKSMIGNMLEELQTEKNVQNEENPSNVNSVFENIESIFTRTEQSKVENDSVLTPPLETNQKPVRKRGRPKKSDSSEKSDGSANISAKERESDAESNITIESISSVHTTDLSSFDDSVSICTDDGNNGRKKKQVPLKKVSSMLTEGRLSRIYKVETTPNEVKKYKTKSISRNVRPQRRIKPNSKYNADTMYCQVKDYSTPRTDSTTSSTTPPYESETDDSEREEEPEMEPKKKKPKVQKVQKEIPSPVKTPSTRLLRNGSTSNDGVTQRIQPPTSSSTPDKASAKRYASSDLYKPRFHFGSANNNRSASAFTIFSS